MADRNYAALPRHCRFGAQRNEFDVVTAVLLETFAGWEREWTDDGTLDAVGLLYVTVKPDGSTVNGPVSFPQAILAEWDFAANAPRDGWHVERADDAADLHGILEAEYRDARETERDLRSGMHW
jgi:hypothetical protein